MLDFHVDLVQLFSEARSGPSIQVLIVVLRGTIVGVPWPDCMSRNSGTIVHIIQVTPAAVVLLVKVHIRIKVTGDRLRHGIIVV